MECFICVSNGNGKNTHKKSMKIECRESPFYWFDVCVHFLPLQNYCFFFK